MALVKIENLKKSFGKFEALKGIDLELKDSSQYVIKGPSGSGKSTLLYLLGGLDRPTEGNVLVEGHNLLEKDDMELASYRNQYVGFVFQFHFLLSSLNCMDNILLPSKIGGLDSAAIEKNIMSLADYLNVVHCLSKFPPELSGGEQQRVNIIRALSLRPKLLLCDEPTGNLDSENSLLVTKLLKSLAVEFGSTLVVVTHDDKIAKHFEHLINMEDGRVIDLVPSVPSVFN